MGGPKSWNGAKKRLKRPGSAEAKASMEQNVGFRADKKAAKAAAAAAKIAAQPRSTIAKPAPRARGGDEKRLRALNKKLREIEALQLSEAAGEALSEASRVGALESTPPSSARRIGIVQDGVESSPPSENRKPPSNAWTSPSEHKESSFLRLPAHPSAYSHILPSQAESSGNPRGGKGRGARSFAALRPYPIRLAIPTAYSHQHSARLSPNSNGYARLRALSIEMLIALHCKGWKNRTDLFRDNVDEPLCFEPTRTCGTRGAAGGSVSARGRSATERGMTKPLIRERL